MTKTPQIDALPGMTPLGIKPNPDQTTLRDAAPDLLFALKAARPHIGVGYSAIQRYSITTLVDAAIAKAEGRS